MDFCVLFCIVPIDSLRILFIFSIDGSSSFRVSNLGGWGGGGCFCFFFNSILKGETNFYVTLRSNLGGCCFRIFFRYEQADV